MMNLNQRNLKPWTDQNQKSLKPWATGLLIAFTAFAIQAGSVKSRGGDPSVFIILSSILFFIWVFVLAISVNRDSKNIKDNSVSPKTPASKELQEAILLIKRARKIQQFFIDFPVICAIMAMSFWVSPFLVLATILIAIDLLVLYSLRSIQDELLVKKLIEKYGEDIAGEAYYTVVLPQVKKIIDQSEEDSDE